MAVLVMITSKEGIMVKIPIYSVPDMVMTSFPTEHIKTKMPIRCVSKGQKLRIPNSVVKGII